MSSHPKYSEFSKRIDIDAFEEAIGFEPKEMRKDNDIGHCPDLYGYHKHGDLTGKFAIHRTKRVWNCWVCGGGSLLSLVEALYDMDSEDATDWCYQFVNRESSDDDFLTEIDNLLQEEADFNENVIPWMPNHILDKWINDHPWFEERGIEPHTIIEYRLGFDPAHLRRSPRTLDEPNFTGPAIILPHYWGDRLVGWQERWLDEDRPKWVPKYTNTTDFPKKYTLFNYDRAMTRKHPIVVVESTPTALMLESMGIPSVATFGGSVSDEQMQYLRRLQQGVILAPDNDTVGVKWLAQLTDYLERFVNVRVTDLVPGTGSDLGDAEDPGALVREAEPSHKR